MTDETTRKERDDDRAEDRRRETTRVKVTDKRMFGPDGELREEYSFLEREGKSEPEREAEPDPSDGHGEGGGPTPGMAGAPGTGGPSPGSGPSPGAGAAPPGAAERPGGARPSEGPGAFGQPSFLDLVSILAEPVAIYLGDVKLPDGRDAENLDLARFHIDLLDVLRDKTEGHLGERERAVLDDLLYRLRMRFVQKRDAQRSGLDNRSDIETPG